VLAFEVPHLKQKKATPILDANTVGFDQVLPAFFALVVTNGDEATAAFCQACRHLFEREQDVFVGKQVRKRVVA
jgi:hypothetical protein